MQIVETFNDPFCVSEDDLPAEYQLELTELQELDEMLATYSVTFIKRLLNVD